MDESEEWDYSKPNWRPLREKYAPAEACRRYCFAHPDVKAEIARLRAELEEALGLIILVVPSCDSMHHKPEDRHDDETPCPIVERIASMRSRIAARERKRGR